MNLAPIVLFVYNRPESTKKVLDSLSLNSEAKNSILYIYCDGPNIESSENFIAKIKETRNIVKNENRFKEVIVIEHISNKGLANSIIDGVTHICKKYGSVIVLEDDIVCSHNFLGFMNKALNFYQNIDQVGSINGYWYPIKNKLPDTFFLKTQSCWGWATWERAWKLFEPDGIKLMEALKKNNLSKSFDLNDSYPYTKMLSEQIKGFNDSWAIRWDASMFLNNKLSLYNNFSLVQNIGFDGSGTNCETSSEFNIDFTNKIYNINSIELIENKSAKKALISFYRKLRLKNFYNRILNYILK